MDELLELKEANAELVADISNLQAVVISNHNLLCKSILGLHERLNLSVELASTRKRIAFVKRRLRIIDAYDASEEDDQARRTQQTLEGERRMLRRELRRLRSERNDLQMYLHWVKEQGKVYAEALRGSSGSEEES